MAYNNNDISLLKANGLSEEAYGDKVNTLIRKKYSLSAELAILRKRDENPEEFAAYNAYAEECKAEARRMVYDI